MSIVHKQEFLWFDSLPLSTTPPHSAFFGALENLSKKVQKSAIHTSFIKHDVCTFYVKRNPCLVLKVVNRKIHHKVSE